MSTSIDASPRAGSLPLRNGLRAVYALSLVIAILVAISAAVGLLFGESIYPSEEVLLAFLPVDLFHLTVGLPVLLGSMWLARRGNLIGLLCWPGALLYVLYSYVMSLLGVPFGALFLPYLLLVPFSAYTTIALVASIDGEEVRQRLSGQVPARAAGILLVVLTSLFILIAVGGVLSAVARQEPVDSLDTMLWIADLAALSPACLVGGILLLRGKPLGYVAGGSLLLAYSMLFFGLVPVLVFPRFYNGSPIAVVDLSMMVALGLATLLLLVLYLRGAISDPQGSPRPASHTA